MSIFNFKYKKIKSLLLLILIVLSTGISFSFLGGGHYFEIAKNMDLYAQLYRELNNHYVDEVEPAKLMRDGIDAMLKSLDPFTNYISAEQIESYKLKRNPAAGDIGVKLQKHTKGIIITEVFEGLAADKAGIKVGDQILEVNGKSAQDRKVNEIKQVLAGQPGSDVKLTLQRAGETARQYITVQRTKDTPKSVPYYGMLNDDMGYIKLNSFTRACSKEVGSAFSSLKKKNDLKGLVFDLRYNGGGLLNEAIAMVNLFVESEELVVFTKGKTPDWDKKYRTKAAPLDKEMPVVVLTNARSASASEILSGVMQDLDRGIVVGRQTYGKGLVQQTKDIGYNSKLKLTVAKYYLPSGRCVQAINYSGRYTDKGASKMPDSLKVAFKTRNGRTVYEGSGVEPDVEVEQKKYSKIIQSLLKNHLVFDYVTEYRNKKATIADVDKYDFSDADFESFVRFLSNKKYDYVTKSEEVLKKLRESAEKEKYGDAVNATITRLENRIKTEKESDLRKNKEELKLLLKHEIVGRYYYSKGKVKVSLDDDNDVKKALVLLADTKAYKKILKGK